MKLLLCVLSFLCILHSSKAWKLPSLPTPSFTRKMRHLPAIALLVGGSLSQMPQPTRAAYIPEKVYVEDVPGLRGSGSLDAFSAAASAVGQGKQTSLSSNPYIKAQNGEIPLSSEPRALKRRVLAACKSDVVLARTDPKVTSYECTQRVLAGELEFMLPAMKDLSVKDQQGLVRSYGK